MADRLAHLRGKRVSTTSQLQTNMPRPLRRQPVERNGEFVCLIGASGCGKSTLYAYGGLRQPSSGEPLVGQADRRTLPDSRHGVPGLLAVPVAEPCV